MVLLRPCSDQSLVLAAERALPTPHRTSRAPAGCESTWRPAEAAMQIGESACHPSTRGVDTLSRGLLSRGEARKAGFARTTSMTKLAAYRRRRALGERTLPGWPRPRGRTAALRRTRRRHSPALPAAVARRAGMKAGLDSHPCPFAGAAMRSGGSGRRRRRRAGASGIPAACRAAVSQVEAAAQKKPRAALRRPSALWMASPRGFEPRSLP